jgi:hypothetical protein
MDDTIDYVHHEIQSTKTLRFILFMSDNCGDMCYSDAKGCVKMIVNEEVHHCMENH